MVPPTGWTEIVFWTLLGLAAAQAMMTLGFVATLARAGRSKRRDCPGGSAQENEPAAPAEPPKVAVVLCLRGTDPFLARCVEALLAQEYRRFDVKIVIDSPDDPARAVVEEAVRRVEGPPVRIEVLDHRDDRSSLKCASVVQAVSGLDGSYDVVALLDADTTPHRSWLSELVAPMADPTVGATTGNRWYVPPTTSWASQIRYVWNAAAIVSMYWYTIAWGGTLAIRLSVVRELDLLDRWSRAFCEDTMLFSLLGSRGYKVVFVPSLMMVNREACRLSGFFTWVCRQLLTARLYHPLWPAVLFHGIAIPLVLTAACTTGLSAMARSRWDAALTAGAGLVVYYLVMVALLVTLEVGARCAVGRRGEPASAGSPGGSGADERSEGPPTSTCPARPEGDPTGWLTAGAVARIAVVIPLTQIVYAAAVAVAATTRTTAWRSIEYKIDGPWKIRRLGYRPYGSSSDPDELGSL